MIKLNINKLGDKVVFTVPLESECRVMGLLKPLSSITDNIDITDLLDEFITGQTTSKLSYIKKSFAAGEFRAGVVTTIRGTDIQAVVTKDDPEDKRYVMYLNEPDHFLEIEYRDADGVTTYKFKPPRQTGYSSGNAFILQYWGIIDEPNLDTNLFISRGVNNVFESVKRLKTVTNIQELGKTGFGFYKLYSNGII